MDTKTKVLIGLLALLVVASGAWWWIGRNTGTGTFLAGYDTDRCDLETEIAIKPLSTGSTMTQNNVQYVTLFTGSHFTFTASLSTTSSCGVRQSNALDAFETQLTSDFTSAVGDPTTREENGRTFLTQEYVVKETANWGDKAKPIKNIELLTKSTIFFQPAQVQGLVHITQAVAPASVAAGAKTTYTITVENTSDVGIFMPSFVVAGPAESRLTLSPVMGEPYSPLFTYNAAKYIAYAYILLPPNHSQDWAYEFTIDADAAAGKTLNHALAATFADGSNVQLASTATVATPADQQMQVNTTNTTIRVALTPAATHGATSVINTTDGRDVFEADMRDIANIVVGEGDVLRMTVNEANTTNAPIRVQRSSDYLLSPKLLTETNERFMSASVSVADATGFQDLTTTQNGFAWNGVVPAQTTGTLATTLTVKNESEWASVRSPIAYLHGTAVTGGVDYAPRVHFVPAVASANRVKLNIAAFDLNGGTVQPGDVIEYRLILSNPVATTQYVRSLSNVFPTNMTGFKLVSMPDGGGDGAPSDMPGLFVPYEDIDRGPFTYMPIVYEMTVKADAKPGDTIVNSVVTTYANKQTYSDAATFTVGDAADTTGNEVTNEPLPEVNPPATQVGTSTPGKTIVAISKGHRPTKPVTTTSSSATNTTTNTTSTNTNTTTNTNSPSTTGEASTGPEQIGMWVTLVALAGSAGVGLILYMLFVRDRRYVVRRK